MAFNKMFVMLPVMLAARNLDGEDPNIIFMLRCVYGVMQTFSMLLVIIIYLKAAAAAKEDGNAIKIYEKILSEHLTTTARGLVGSTLFGICMTVGLHIWKGMVVGLAIQSIMAPFNLYENALVKAIFMKGGFVDLKEKKIFAEKVRDELTDEDDVLDGEGNVVKLTKEIVESKTGKNKKGSAKKETKSFEDVLLDTWDLGADADIKPLMGMLSKKNINFATSENGWTPIMIMSGLGAKSAPGAMRQMKALGANPAKLDKEGWNALHWSAFHGSPDAAKVLLAKDDFDGIAMGLHEVADKEGKNAVTHAKDEGNDDVAKVIEEAEPSDLADGTAGEGLRKRK